MDVVCLGNFVADIVARPVERLPEKGKLDLIDKMELHTGGCAANTGVGLARLGIKTRLLGKVGEDDFGDFIIKRMESLGLDTKGLKRDKDANTSATVVLVHNDGERSFIHYIGANAELSQGDIDFGIINGARILHIAGFNLMPKLDGAPTAEVFKIAKDKGILTSLDTCWDSEDRWLRLIKPVFPFTDYFLPSIEEARMITGKDSPPDIADFLLDCGVKTVALKLGKGGCFIKSNTTEVTIPAYKVDVVDATGAGDAFVAGFLTGIIKGWDLERCGRLGNAVGAGCVTEMGATGGIKGFRETISFIKKNN